MECSQASTWTLLFLEVTITVFLPVHTKKHPICMLLLGSCYFCLQKRCRAMLAFFFKHVQLVANYRQIWTKTLNMLHLVRIKEQFLIKMPTLEIYRGINVSKYHQGTHANTRLNIFSLLTRMFIKEIGARAW